MHSQAGLFPGYRNTDKLKRDLKRFGTICSIIKEAGYFHFYLNEKCKGSRETQIFQEGGKQIRLTARQFRAVVTGSKIRLGMSADNPSVEDVMRLLEAAGHLEKNDPDAPTIARGIMATFEQIVASMRNQQLQDDNGQAIGERLVEVFGGLI